MLIYTFFFVVKIFNRNKMSEELTDELTEEQIEDFRAAFTICMRKKKF